MYQRIENRQKNRPFGLHKNIRVICGICGFKASHKFLQIILGKMACFSIILHTFANKRSKNPSCHDRQ